MCGFFFLCPCLGFQSPWGKKKLILCYSVLSAYGLHVWNYVVVACATYSEAVAQYSWQNAFLYWCCHWCSVCGWWAESLFYDLGHWVEGLSTIGMDFKCPLYNSCFYHTEDVNTHTLQLYLQHVRCKNSQYSHSHENCLSPHRYNVID